MDKEKTLREMKLIRDSFTKANNNLQTVQGGREEELLKSYARNGEGRREDEGQLPKNIQWGTKQTSSTFFNCAEKN